MVTFKPTVSLSFFTLIKRLFSSSSISITGVISSVIEIEEELKSLLMKVKVEREKLGLKLDIPKTKIMASGPVTLWEIDGKTVETV